jgi:hypothetical protein
LDATMPNQLTLTGLHSPSLHFGIIRKAANLFDLNSQPMSAATKR